MSYYKIINGDNFIGVCTADDFRCYQKKHNILIRCNANSAEYIRHNEELYKADWFKTNKDSTFEAVEVSVVPILEEEYRALCEMIELGETISVAEHEAQVEEEPEIAPEQEVSIEYVREIKIKEMSLACEKAITDGFNLTLDDVDYHFSLTMEDQMNLISAQSRILSGKREIVYHADGEEYKIYSPEEMTLIINAADYHKTYQLAYFNSLKAWVNGLNRISNIQAIQYGDDIPKKYQTAVYKVFSPT